MFLIPLNPGQYSVDCGHGNKCVVEIGKKEVKIVKLCTVHKNKFDLGEKVNCMYEVRIHSLEKVDNA